MIALVWRGRATAENAPRYQEHATRQVFPSLTVLPGHRGAYLLKRKAESGVEFMAVTLWDSIESIKGFSREDPDVAVVELEARVVLSQFDDFARHYDVVGGLNTSG